MISYSKPDLHLHSCYSDGTDTPAKLLKKVRESKIDIFALTDHDTMDGCEELSSLLQAGDPIFIPGIEFSCEDAEGKYHILGYGCDSHSSELTRLVELAHELRLRKLDARLEYLAEKYGFVVSASERAELLKETNPGKPHIVSLLRRKGLISASKEGYALFEGYSEPVENIAPETAVRTILASDGIPVLAHGILADGSKNLTLAQIEGRVERLKNAGLRGLECYYSTFTPEQKAIMLDLARRYQLLITAGSDYHGANKTVAIGEINGENLSLLEPFYASLGLGKE